MFYQVRVKDHVSVHPKAFGLSVKDAVIQGIKKKYDGLISKDFGIVIDVANVSEVREGVIIPGDGSVYYDADFEILTFKPEMQEVLSGRINDIADFGAFITLGPIDGMIHVSQAMDDYVSFSKDKTLLGKESKRSLKVGDRCRARIIAVSFKDVNNPKLGLTMRQQGLGKLEWLEEQREKPKQEAGREKAASSMKKEKSAKDKK